MKTIEVHRKKVQESLALSAMCLDHSSSVVRALARKVWLHMSHLLDAVDKQNHKS